MRTKTKILVSLLMLGLIAVGLSPAAAQNSTEEATDSGPVVAVNFTEGQQLLKEGFDSPDAWEKYNSGDVDFEVKNGAYLMHIPKTLPNSFIWGVGATTQSDVIMEATFTQKANTASSEFGMMCRADSNGLGYYFIIEGDGSGFIGKGVETSIEHLTDTLQSAAIKAGAASNTMRAVCVGNYLALFVNGDLVAEANDDQYTSGVAGFAALAGTDADADITVDDLSISTAEIAAPTDVPTDVATDVPTTDANTTDVPVTPINFTRGNSLLHTTFTSENDWPSFSDDNGIKLGVSSGAYNIHIPKDQSNSFFWGLNTEDYTDTVIDATINLADDNPDGAYGVMCRASQDTNGGNGYFFIVSGNGLAYIAKDTGSTVDDLTAELTTDAINLGSQTNKITAVCVGNYLALYVNDQLIVDANDDEFSHGAAGLVALSGAKQDTNVEVHSLDILDAVNGGTAPVSTKVATTIAPTTEASTNGPAIAGVIIGKTLLTETFDEEDAWEKYEPDDQTASLRVEHGAYRETLNSNDYFQYGLNDSIETNTVVQVDAVLDRGPADNWMGIMCRASEKSDGSGYYFVISSLGDYAIRRYDVADEKFVQLVDWAKSPEIKTGRATNTMTAVCVDDYLALYVNGVKIADTTDSTYTDGVTGLASYSYDKGTLDVHFDNMTIYDAKKAS